MVVVWMVGCDGVDVGGPCAWLLVGVEGCGWLEGESGVVSAVLGMVRSSGS